MSTPSRRPTVVRHARGSSTSHDPRMRVRAIIRRDRRDRVRARVDRRSRGHSTRRDVINITRPRVVLSGDTAREADENGDTSSRVARTEIDMASIARSAVFGNTAFAVRAKSAKRCVSSTTRPTRAIERIAVDDRATGAWAPRRRSRSRVISGSGTARENVSIDRARRWTRARGSRA